MRSYTSLGVITVLFLVVSTALCEAQVLTTAETLGRGKQALTISTNHLYDAGVQLDVHYVLYARGLTSRFDLYAAVGDTHIIGEDQAWVGVGQNAKLFSVDSYSVSFFSLASVPLHRFNQASTVVLNAAVIVSRPINSRLSVYSGANVFVPIGARSRGLFTPTANRFNIPLGSSLAFGTWTLAAEGDVGALKALGIAVSKTF